MAIKMQFGMPSWVDPWNVLDGVCRCPHRRRHFWDCLDDWKALQNRILGLGKMVNCTEGWTNLNDLYVIWCVLCREMPSGDHDDCTWVKSLWHEFFKITISYAFDNVIIWQLYLSVNHTTSYWLNQSATTYGSNGHRGGFWQ